MISPAIARRSRRTGNRGFLLTPGPLTTDRSVKRAMLRDWGSREADFIALTAGVRNDLVALALGDPTQGRGASLQDYTSIPLQGSGTFAIEALLGTLVGPEDRLLVLANGAYGERMIKIARHAGRMVEALRSDEEAPFDPTLLAGHLDRKGEVPTHLALVHCETTTGVHNPLAEISAICRTHGITLLLDAMSSFGALPVDCAAFGIGAVAASANKCLQGAPGIAFIVGRRDLFMTRQTYAPTISLDLRAQLAGFESDGQWRFTPPTQIVAALRAALDDLAAEGGVPARLARYTKNCRILTKGMARLGFHPILAPEAQAPIIVTFPENGIDGAELHDRLGKRGIAIYPGKLTRTKSFRIGCIGAIQPPDMRAILTEIGYEIEEMTA